MSEEYINVKKNKILDLIKNYQIKDFDLFIDLFGENKEIILEFCKQYILKHEIYEKIFNIHKDNRDVMLNLIKIKPLFFEINQKKEIFLNDKELVLEAVKNNTLALEFASENLRNDKEVVLEAVKQNGYSLQYASNELQNNKEIVLLSVKNNSLALEFASENLRNDKEVVLEAVKQGGYGYALLQYASEELQNDREIVLEAVKKNGYALKHASKELQNDKDFIYELYKEGCTNFFLCSSKEIRKGSDNSLKKFVKKFEIIKLNEEILSKIELKENNIKGNKI